MKALYDAFSFLWVKIGGKLQKYGKRNLANHIVLLISGIFLALTITDQAHAYIGPGAGFAIAGSLLAMFTALLAGIFAIFTWPIRYLIRWVRGRRAFARSRVRKFVILGLDGLDFGLTEQFLSEGKLPNMAKIRDEGCFKPLGTTVPPISPVAWSSFQTGVNPGKHSIFDFLTRDTQNYQPKLSSVDIREPRRKISFGRYQFPLGKAQIRLLRRSKPFWKILSSYGIFSSVIRVPITFPPEKLRGVQLSGMCVPDLRGTQGMFSYYTDQDNGSGEHTGGENHKVIRQGNIIKAELVGSVNPLRKDNSILRCPFVVTIKDQNSAELSINGENYKLTKNVYSQWIRVSFKAAPGVRIHGICKFLLLNTEPEFELYVTPVNIDPEKPVMPIAYPTAYSTYLAKYQGSFATLGLAEDSWALNEKIIDDNSFMQQCIDMDQEREKMFFDSMNKVKRGLCLCVFDGTDRIQHTFWRYIDKQHPANNGKDQDKQYYNVIEELYRRMDVLVGKTLSRCKKDTMLMIISDHGFNSFRRGVDLNRWLEENGYLKVKGGLRDEKHLAAVDWSQTRAFAMGLSGIFLNLKGRESQGIVDPEAEAAQLREEIAGKLIKLTDPDTKKSIIKNVYNAFKVYNGPYRNESPDLIVGYERGYRASWETAIGKITDGIFHDNTKAWSGDHCIDPTLVPGILFCNRHIESGEPCLMDIAPTVLEMFGIGVPDYMDGKPLVVSTK